MLAATIVLSSAYRPTEARANKPALLLAGNRTISGTVLKPDGKPAENSPVKLTKYVADQGPTRRPPGGSPTGDSRVGVPDAQRLQKGSGAGAVVATTTTDSAGKFTLKNIEPGDYIIVAGTPQAAGKLQLKVEKDNDPQPVTIKLMSATR